MCDENYVVTLKYWGWNGRKVSVRDVNKNIKNWRKGCCKGMLNVQSGWSGKV
jgi:hypothetical protein